MKKRVMQTLFLPNRRARPVLDRNRRCLAPRSLRSLRRASRSRRRSRTRRHQGDRDDLYRRLAREISHRTTGFRLHRSPQSPPLNHPRPPRQPPGQPTNILKFQISLASLGYALSLQFSTICNYDRRKTESCLPAHWIKRPAPNELRRKCPARSPGCRTPSRTSRSEAAGEAHEA